MRKTLAESLQSSGVASNQVILQSMGSAEVTLAVGVAGVYRIEVGSESVESIKTTLEDYVNTRKTYESELNKLGGNLAGVKASVSTSTYKVSKYSSMNAVVVVLLVILILFIILFGGFVFVYLKVRVKPTPKGGLKHSNENYIPAGNVGTHYDSQYSPTNVSDEEEDYKPRRSPKKQPRYEEDDEEEEEYRPRHSRNSRKERV